VVGEVDAVGSVARLGAAGLPGRWIDRRLARRGIPIAKWYDDRIIKVKDDKPIVLTELRDDGRYELRNIGSAPAVNVWLILADHDEPIALGALDAHKERIVPESIELTIRAAANAAHVLLAAAPPGPCVPTPLL
jgi:hypothetical protein